MDLAYFPILMWAIFSGAVLLTLSLASILAYHWFRYAMNKRASLVALTVFSGGSLFLIGALFSATLAVIAAV